MRFVIVGAGLAGHRAATHLRELSSEAQIDLIGDEKTLPYDRPPLSKEMLGGGAAKFLATRETYEGSHIAYHPGENVIRIDRAARSVVTASGQSFPYDRLLLTTGSRLRRLPDDIAKSRRIIYLRTLEDAAQLQAALKPGKRIAVIGGGFIGLEVAAAACTAGVNVIVFEAAPRLLSRGMPALLGDWIRAEHEARGVSIHLGTAVRQIADLQNKCLRLDWDSGFAEVDAVVAGIGIEPNVELARDAGLVTDDGIIVDERCQTSDSTVFAAGEVTSHPVLGGPRQRLESWRVASDQSLVAAMSMSGVAARYAAPPWLWSDQFGYNIQSLGVPIELGRTIILGDVAGSRWTAIFCDTKDQINGAIAVNNGRDIAALKRAIMKDGRVPDVLMARAAAAQDAPMDANPK